MGFLQGFDHESRLAVPAEVLRPKGSWESMSFAGFPVAASCVQRQANSSCRSRKAVSLEMEDWRA